MEIGLNVWLLYTINMIPGIPSSSSYNNLAWLLAHSYIPSLMALHPLKAVITRLGSMMPRSDVAPKAAVADFPFPYYSEKGTISRKETDKPQQMKIQFEFQMNDCEPWLPQCGFASSNSPIMTGIFCHSGGGTKLKKLGR